MNGLLCFRRLLFFLLFLGSAGASLSSEFTLERPRSDAYKKYLSPGKLSVVASFDGSKSPEVWEETLTFAAAHGVKFTFFISGIYFLTEEDKCQYKDPRSPQACGKSDIGFGGTAADVEKRIAYVQRALEEGHDIQSHLNGHFDGSRWPIENWEREFAQYDSLTSFAPKARHVRFPLLAVNDNAKIVMADTGYHSIVSMVRGKDPGLFFRSTVEGISGEQIEILEYPIPFVEGSGYKNISMDYNFYAADKKRGRNDPAAIEQNVYKLYMQLGKLAFEKGYPLFLSHHFSRWRSGAYWKAMRRALVDLKGKYPVEFLTISELTQKIKEKSSSDPN